LIADIKDIVKYFVGILMHINFGWIGSEMIYIKVATLGRSLPFCYNSVGGVAHITIYSPSFLHLCYMFLQKIYDDNYK